LSGDRSLIQPNKDIDILRRMRAVAADPERDGSKSPLPSKEKRFPELTVFQ